MIDFVQPFLLLGLFTLPVIWWLARKSQLPLSPARTRAATITRIVAVLFFVLALADMRIEWDTDEVNAAFVVDPSPSISAAERQEFTAEVASFSENHRETTAISSAVARRPLAEQIQAVVAAMPTGAPRRMVVASDGHGADADARIAIRDARRAGVEVFVRSIGDAPYADQLAVTGLEAPRLVRAGEQLDVEAAVFMSEPGTVQLTLKVGDEEDIELEVRAPAGLSRHPIAVEFPRDPGLIEMALSGSTSGDRISDNNSFRTQVRVLSRPRVMLITEVNGPVPVLSTVLGEAEFAVTTETIATAPETALGYDPYGLVIIDEVKLSNLSEERQQAIVTWVEDLGGGLITVTNDNAVTSAPRILREIEPIRRPPAIPEPRPLELVLTIDRSSSMSGRSMAQARGAAAAAVRALRSDARVGTVAFSGGADHVMAPVNVDEGGEDAANFINRINAGGGTNIAAALSAAGGIMSDDPRYIHHVILLSDGESDPGSAIAAASGLAARGITISVISIGGYSALMAQIAAIGRGRYHVTQNPGSLPALMVRESQYRQPPAHRRMSFRPEIHVQNGMTRGLDFAQGPPLLGYALAALKPDANLILGLPDRSPLLAHWHREQGQVASFTSSTTGGWANEFRSWGGFRTLWTQTAWAVMRTRQPNAVRVEITTPFRSPGERLVSVFAPDLREEVLPITRLFRLEHGAADGEDGGETEEAGESLELTRSGPGTWEARVPVESGFFVDSRMPEDHEPTDAEVATANYNPQLQSFGSDPVELAAWAELGGGIVVDDLANVLIDPPTAEVVKSLRIPLFVAALVLYLLGLLLLRLPESARSIAKQDAQKAERTDVSDKTERREAA